MRIASPSRAEVPPRPVADREVFSDHPAPEELLERFTERLTALRGEVVVAASEEEAAARLEELLDEHAGAPAVACEDPLVEALVTARPVLASRIDSSHAVRASSVELARFGVGITGCVALVARTGSVVVNSERDGGRRLSVLPPCHVVVARVGQLVASLEDALRLLRENGRWSSASVITGPSRTADIEKILVLGAHGPKRLRVVIIT